MIKGVRKQELLWQIKRKKNHMKEKSSRETGSNKSPFLYVGLLMLFFSAAATLLHFKQIS